MIKYTEFLIYKLCESVMITTADFKKIIEDMPSANKIADDIYEIINKRKDVKTNYNAIGLSDKNDEISFIPDTQYQRVISAGEDPWTKTKSKSKIGRMIRQVLIDNPGVTTSKYTDAQIEEFVNLFKTAWDKKNSIKRKIEIVKGDKVLYWYNKDNYAEEGGTLGNSCMRFPSKNHFMKIYSENPDKISLVALTEDDKLLARAILWKLDKSREGSEYYLDRIYTRFDSDYEYVYNWVLEKVANNNKSILSSHRMGTGSRMIVELKKTEFEKYPYADTFCYLYKKSDNGKVSGSGFISNSDMAADFPDHIGYQLQNTDGSIDIFTHRYSERKGIYIRRDEAVWIESIGDYIKKSETKQCKSLGEYYLVDDVVYSERMDDWIPKDQAYDHPKFGIILEDYLIKVLVGYKGDKTDPLDIYQQLSNGNSDENKYIEVEENIRVDGSEDYFSVSRRIRNVPSYCDIKLKVEDAWGYYLIDFLCYKMYKVSGKKELKPSLVIYERYNNYYITKEESNFYDIEVEDDNFIYVFAPNYTELCNREYYQEKMSDIESSDKPDIIKDKFKEFVERVHDFKKSNESDYKSYQSSIELLNKISGGDANRAIVELSDLTISKTKELLKDSYKNSIVSKFSREIGQPVEGNDADNVVILSEVAFTFFVASRESGSNTREYLRKLVDHYKDKLSTIILDNIDSIFSSFYYEMRYEYKDNLSQVEYELFDKYNFNISRSDFNYMLANKCDIDKLIDYYKNLPIK